ncbi:MAG: cytochrome c3 family protein [Candidatus Aminicenantia bacterium]
MKKELKVVIIGLFIFLKYNVYANDQCISCHGKKEFVKEERLFVDENLFRSSVHGNFSCTDCHINVKLIENKHEKIVPEVNCTLLCHQTAEEKFGKIFISYKDSVHGKAVERGEKEAAKCWDCHTKHNVRNSRDPLSSTYRMNIPITCSNCHEDMSVVFKFNIHKEKPYANYRRSVHGRGLFEDGLINFSAVCTDCHGIHDIKGVPATEAKSPNTCGKCHIKIFEEYARSIHGREALKGNPDVPLCIDCHGEHSMKFPYDKEAKISLLKVSDTCSECHSRPEIMNRYGIPLDRVDSFIESMHGIAIGYGYRAAANCTSCHGVHNILPASDPASNVHPSNLRDTCGQKNCHPGMPDKIMNQKIHRVYEKEKKGIYYLRVILVWFVIIILVITFIWVVPDIVHRVKMRIKR